VKKHDLVRIWKMRKFDCFVHVTPRFYMIQFDSLYDLSIMCCAFYDLQTPYIFLSALGLNNFFLLGNSLGLFTSHFFWGDVLAVSTKVAWV